MQYITMLKACLALILSFLFLPSTYSYEIGDVVGTDIRTKKRTAVKAATEYFKKRQKKKAPRHSQRSPSSESSRSSPHYLAIHVGPFLDDTVYLWGNDNKNDIGNMTFGVTYRIGEWVNSMDLFFRGDFLTFNKDHKDLLKLSLMPMVGFPDVNSQFPLYFGAGVGVGVFFKQLKNESNISLDYQLVAGLRLLELIDSTGFLFELAMKNHLHLLSDGQHNGVTASLGLTFNF